MAMLCAPLLAACAGTTSSAGDDCTSEYEYLASAATRAGLHYELVSGTVPRVESVRVQGRHDGKATVDLLDRRGRRVHQVDVWQRDDGRWVAGLWHQCID